MRLHVIVRAAIMAVATLVWVGISPAAGQLGGLDSGQGFEDVPRVGIGYVANAPNMFAGVSAYLLTDRLGGLGLYIDGKMNMESPGDEPDFIDSLTVEDVEALPGQLEQVDGHGWWSVNAALLRPLTPEFMVYVGAGYTHQDAYLRYRDPEAAIHPTGLYWVSNDAETGGNVNFLAGVFFRMTNHLAMQFGYESVPQGVTVGGSYSFSL